MDKDLLIAYGALLNVAWWPGWEGRSEENGCIVHMAGSLSFLFTWNCHNIICWLAIPSWKLLSRVWLFATPWASPWNSPGQKTGVDSLSLLQGIFPTQGLNSGLLHYRQILYQLNHKGSPKKGTLWLHCPGKEPRAPTWQARILPLTHPLQYKIKILEKYSVMAYMGRESIKSGHMYVYNWFTLLYSRN